MIESDAQLRVALQKIEDLKESLRQDFSEIPGDVREEVIRQRQEMIREFEQEILDYQGTNRSEDQVV